MFHLFVSLSCFPTYLLYSTSEIKELFILFTETTVYSQLLPSASSLVRNKVNTSLRLEQIVWVMSVSCVGEGSNIVCQVHILCFFQLTMYKMFQTLCHSVQQSFKPCVTPWYKPCFTLWYKASNLTLLCDTKFQTLCHSVIQKLSNLESLSDTNSL